MCEPTLIAGALVAGSAAYSADRQGSAAHRARVQQEQQAQMALDAEGRRLAAEQQMSDQGLAAQRAAMGEQQRMFNEQQAAAQRAAEEARQAEIRRQNNIQEGQGIISDVFGQFNDDFYTGRQQSYVDYARPQLEQQYQDAMQSLVRSLARSGNLSSSLRGQSMSDLQRQFDQGLATIQSQGSNYSSQARSQIEAARAGLIGQNATLADPGTVRGLAEAQASSLSQADTYSPISSLISALTRGASDAAGSTPDEKSKPKGVGLVSNGLTRGSSSLVA